MTTTALPTVTENEKTMLNNIARSLYQPVNGSYPETFKDTSSVWLFDCVDGFKKRSVPGIVASLNKKGLTGSQLATDKDDHDCIWLTELGFQVWQSLFPNDTMSADEAEAEGEAPLGGNAPNLDAPPAVPVLMRTDEEKILHVLSIPNAGYTRRQIRDLSGVGEEPTYRILRQLVADGRIHGRMVKGTKDGRPFRLMSFWRETNQMEVK